MTDQGFRYERDSLGEIAVPTGALYGAQSARSLINFPIGKDRFPLSGIYALVEIKRAAAKVNRELSSLDEQKEKRIMQACDEILSGKYDDQFVVSLWQTGSGTQSNMNVNEVIANLANRGLTLEEKIHPNDHVNQSQSSNDTVITAIHIAAADLVYRKLLPAIAGLRGSFHNKEKQFQSIIKVGRTHLQDATPVRLGQEFGSFASMMISAQRRIHSAVQEIQFLAIGGTAVGTGINAPEGYRAKMVAELSRRFQIPFQSAPDLFEAMSSRSAIAYFHGSLKALATDLFKIASDIRWMSSGPRSGLGEIELPANEPGSSIMPGKVNPTQAEALTMICTRVLSNDQSIAMGASQGNFELNVFQPLIAADVFESIEILADGMNSFALRCVDGIKANEQQLKNMMERSLMLVTALSPRIGYDRAAEIAKKAHRENISLKAAALDLGVLSEEEFEALVQPENMV